jgi:hypothetical protein
MGLFALALFVYVGLLNPGSPITLVDILGLIAFLTPAFVGAYLVWRLPSNPVGWILAGFGLTFTLGVIGETIALTDHPLASFGAWLSTWAWAGSMVLILVLLPLLFPDGALPSPRYRWVAPTSLVGLASIVVGNAFKTTTVIDQVEVALPLPLDLPLAVFDISSALGMALMLIAVGGAVTACVVRFRRSRGVEHQQMRVFVTALVVSVMGMGLNLVFYETGDEALANAIFAAFVLVLVGSIAMAVLRYRLYDFDRVISRTVTYALLVLILGSMYVVGAVWLPTRLVGQESSLFVAASTLAVAALFTPIRRVVMRVVDRRFNRSAYDAQRITDGFAAHLRDRVDAELLAADWANLVTGALEPSLVGVWIRSEKAPGSS